MASSIKRFALPAIILALVPLLFIEAPVTRWLESKRATRQLGEVLYETHSAFSHIRVRELGSTRCLTFVDPNGREERQSAIDMAAPHQMQLGYTASFFASLLFREPQERVLIVGLGGGGMVRFLNHAFPDTLVEVVEIDPAVVDVAASYFGTHEGPSTRIHVADAFVYLQDAHGPYDALYMDAFLKPSLDSNLDALTQRLKTIEFLKSLHRQLHPNGVAAFNLHLHAPTTASDLIALNEAFPQVYLFDVPQTGNLIAVATMISERLTKITLTERAIQLDEQLDVGLSFQGFVSVLRDE